MMLAGKLGGVLVVCLVKGCRLDPSKSFDEAILVLATMNRFWIDGRHALSPDRGASR